MKLVFNDWIRERKQLPSFRKLEALEVRHGSFFGQSVMKTKKHQMCGTKRDSAPLHGCFRAA